MRDLALRAHMRRSFYAAFIAMSSSRRGASRDARVTNGFVRARVRLRTTRLDSSGESVAPIFDNQLWPDVMARFEQPDATGYLRWGGPRQGLARCPPPGWTAVGLPRATWARSATATRTTGMSFDLNIELCVRLRVMALTIELRARSIGQQSEPCVRDSATSVALRQSYRRWRVSDED
jgi:hypothetical protein